MSMTLEGYLERLSWFAGWCRTVGAMVENGSLGRKFDWRLAVEYQNSRFALKEMAAEIGLTEEADEEFHQDVGAPFGPHAWIRFVGLV